MIIVSSQNKAYWEEEIKLEKWAHEYSKLIDDEMLAKAEYYVENGWRPDMEGRYESLGWNSYSQRQRKHFFEEKVKEDPDYAQRMV